MMDAMPSVDSLLVDLDDEQREAVLAPRGPVCVLAGAGTGKTRTITRRIAYLVSAGHVSPGQVLAVTCTARDARQQTASCSFGVSVTKVARVAATRFKFVST